MGRKSKKKKAKKISMKKEKYLKFRKEKNTAIDITMPELTPEQNKQKQEDEMKIGRFLRFNKNPPQKELKEKMLKRR
ncbi:hypothetical protein HYU09_01570 [Candidatus Woesearchaeota archaeon]|nr:hypothetical protein [Candidatus Woesearchaeota archaeon]